MFFWASKPSFAACRVPGVSFGTRQWALQRRSNGSQENPAYRNVCTDYDRPCRKFVQSHFLDPEKNSATNSTMIKRFLRTIHDPNQVIIATQGPDHGAPQYRDAIFFHSHDRAGSRSGKKSKQPPIESRRDQAASPSGHGNTPAALVLARRGNTTSVYLEKSAARQVTYLRKIAASTNTNLFCTFVITSISFGVRALNGLSSEPIPTRIGGRNSTEAPARKLSVEILGSETTRSSRMTTVFV